MPARDALHWQMILKDDLAEGGVMEEMLDSFERSQRGMLDQSDVPDEIQALPAPYGRFKPTVRYKPLELAKHWRGHLDLALAYYVDPRMTALVTAAAEDMPPNPLRPEDLPSTHGFMLLPSGMTEIDIRGQFMVHNAVMWFQYAGGVDIWYLSNKYDERDSLNQKHRRLYPDTWDSFPMLMPAVYTRLEFGGDIPMQAGGTKVLPPEISDKLYVVPGPNETSIAWAWPEGYDMTEWIEDMNTVKPAASVLWVIACWRLMQQTIIDVRTEPVDRALRRAAVKRKLKQAAVTVIALRKRKRLPSEGPEQEIEWSHRWLRRGHWRQQWVGPLDGDENERYQTPIYIHATICGPDDKPLLIRDHVYSLER